MFAKFNQKLDSFNAIIGIDLAAHKSGLCLYDINTRQIVDTTAINVKSTTDREKELFDSLRNYFRNVVENYGRVLLIEERCPNQAGRYSTIQALQALMGAHWIMRLAAEETEGITRYDECGIHSTSVKALFRSEAIPKPEKSDIRRAMVEYYNLDDSKLTDDISDAIAVIHTLIQRKWNQDITDEIKAVKKEIKTLKAPKAIELRNQRIEQLNSLKL